MQNLTARTSGYLFERPVLPIALSLLALAGAIMVGFAPELAPRMLMLFAGIVAFLLIVRNPLIGVGMVGALVVTGGLSQIASGGVVQRLYLVFFILTSLAYAHHLYSDPAMLREWLRIRTSDVLMLALLLVAFLSFSVARQPRAALDDFESLAKAGALFFLASRAIRTRNDLIFVGKFVLVAGIIQAAWAWTQGAMSRRTTGNIDRVSGNLTNANAFAMALLVATPWTFYFARYGKRLWRILAIAGIVLLSVTILRTVSRTGLVALGFVVLLWPMAASRRFHNRLTFLLPLLIMFIVIVSFYWDSIATRWPTLAELFNSSNVMYVYNDDGGRAELREIAWRGFTQHWPIGVGIGNAPYLVAQELHRSRPFHVHNMYLEVALDLGLPGILAFLGLIASAIATALWTLARAPDDQTRALVATALAVLSTWLVFGLAGNRHYQNAAYFMLACTFVVANFVNARSDGQSARLSERESEREGKGFALP